VKKAICVNGCGEPVQPPSKVLCRRCFAELDRKMTGLLERMRDKAEDIAARPAPAKEQS
jgi:hypothetical protein